MKKFRFDFTSDIVINRSILKFIDDYLLKEDPQAVQILLFLISMYEKEVELDLEQIARIYHLEVEEAKKILHHWKEKGIIHFEEECMKDPNKENENKAKTEEEEMEAVHRDEDFLQFCYLYQAYTSEMSSMDYLNLKKVYLCCQKDLMLALYLIDVCMDNVKNLNSAYLLTVAKDWQKRGIRDKETAKSYISNRKSHVTAVSQAFGIRDRLLAKAELAYVEEWVNYDVDLIREACSRTVLNLSKVNFKYADKMLKAWHQAGVMRYDDLKDYDATHSYQAREDKAKSDSKPRKKGKNAFHDFDQREYDYDALEKLLEKKSVQGNDSWEED